MKDNNIIDLFCGAGGMSLGFEQVGFNSKLGIDFWDDAIETYNFNRKNKVGISIDIHDFSNDKIKSFIKQYKIDGIVGGPPCQGFSMVGKRIVHDKRNSLYLEYVRFVKNVNPKFFVLENVKGLLSLGGGEIKKSIIKEFSNIGYNVSYKILKASDYGVPQDRERVFFIGLNKKVFGKKFFDFNKLKQEPKVSTSEALDDLPLLDNKFSNNYRFEPSNTYQREMRQNSKKVYNHEKTNHTKETINIISMIKDGGSIKDLDEKYYKVRNYNTAFKRMNSKLPSITIDCGHRNYFHYKENRIPTVRESARLQSFPDTYIFNGSRTSQYTQVGNAVPVKLAKKVATEILNIINK